MNPLIYKEDADAAEVIGKVPESPKKETKILEPKILRALTISQWASIVNYLSQFREGPQVQSKKDDDIIKKILDDLLKTPEPSQKRFLYLPKWRECKPNIWKHGLAGHFDRIFSRDEYQRFFLTNTPFHIYPKFTSKEMRIIVESFFSDFNYWYDPLFPEQCAKLKDAGIESISDSYTPKQAYDLFCILKQGEVAS